MYYNVNLLERAMTLLRLLYMTVQLVQLAVGFHHRMSSSTQVVIFCLLIYKRVYMEKLTQGRRNKFWEANVPIIVFAGLKQYCYQR